MYMEHVYKNTFKQKLKKTFLNEMLFSLGDNLGCFGGSRKKREMVGHQLKEGATGSRSTGHRNQPIRGMELLWQPDLVSFSYSKSIEQSRTTRLGIL